MLKFVSKFVMDLLPPVVATIIGAYIVNHYIITKPGADAPVAAAVSPVDPRKADIRDDAKSPAASINDANRPEPDTKTKGISEKASREKTASGRLTGIEKSAEAASIPADIHRQPALPREKVVGRSIPGQTTSSLPVTTAAPVVAAPNTTPPVEAAIAPEEHRDANDLARAAIERLRSASDGAQQMQEAAPIPDTPRVATVPPIVSLPVVATPVQPLPPPIMVSAPAAEPFDAASGSSRAGPSYPGAGINDTGHPVPPADIPIVSTSSPTSRPLDLHAEATEPLVRERTTVAEDMLSAAKSVFHAVLPK